MATANADEFVRRFFGDGNYAWPHLDPTDRVFPLLRPFLEVLEDRGECPLVLPRRRLSMLPIEMYVIAWDTAHASRVRNLLEAAVAHHWSPFDGRVASLNRSDPVDAAVLDFVGPGTTYVLKPSVETVGRMTTAMQRMVRSLSGRPLRRPTWIRPVGRMLREFDLALASGAVDASATILNEIEQLGGISHENVAFLRVRRLSRLGQDDALLADQSLSALVYSEPPFLVREAVLGAWARTTVLPALAAGGREAALQVIKDAEPDVAMLVDRRMVGATDVDAAAVSALVAVARGDAELADALADGSRLPADVDKAVRPGLAPKGHVEGDLARAPDAVEGAVAPSDEDEGDVPVGVDSWIAWIKMLDQSGAGRAIEAAEAEQWQPPWQVDEALAGRIDSFSEFNVDALLQGVALLLEHDDPDHPASRTASAFLNRFLLAERFAPADLGAICALIQIVLRGAPGEEGYHQLLQDVLDYSAQWVSVANAVRVIDIADSVACGPAFGFRNNVVTALLSPLSAQCTRLSRSIRELAELVTADLALGLDWTVPDAVRTTDLETQAVPVTARVLLYSLDRGALARTSDVIAAQWPEASVETSADKVGSDSLKMHARNADVIILATRRAAHAATGFITGNAGEGTIIGYADGSGSASMVRAVECALVEWVNASTEPV